MPDPTLHLAPVHSPLCGAEEVIPVWRGLLHAYAFWLALAAAATLVALAPTRDARLAATIYGVALCALFAVSGLYHRWRWDPRWRPLLRRLDHSTIFLFIAASTTPVALLVLGGTAGTVVLLAVWLGALAGIGMTVAWIDAPRGVVALSYVTVGCAVGAAAPQLVARLAVAPLVLLAAGGVLYCAGAAVYATRRPDPWPQSFGFHEVFHGLVVLAAASHFIAMLVWVVPGAAGV
jgi:hemolysin III